MPASEVLNPLKNSNCSKKEEYGVAVESSKVVQKCKIQQWVNNWWDQSIFPSYILG